MGIRWLHRTWMYFWSTLGVLTATFGLLLILTYLVFQLPTSKNFILNTITERINSNQSIHLEIGELTGNVPFDVIISEIDVYSNKEKDVQILSTDSVEISIDISSLFQKRIQFSTLNIHSPNIILSSSMLSTDNSNVELNNDQMVDADTIGFNWEVIAPQLTIENGTVDFQDIDVQQFGALNDEISTIKELNLDLFLDINKEEKFIDVEFLSFSVPEANIDNVEMFGQIFNDVSQLEFNAFNINSNTASLRFNGRIDGVNVVDGNLFDQIKSSEVIAEINELTFKSETAKKVIPEFPAIKQSITLSGNVIGSIDSLSVEEFVIEVGNSSTLSSIGINFAERNVFSIEANQLNLDSTDLATWFPNIEPNILQAIADIDLSGEAISKQDVVQFSLDSESSRGGVKAKGIFNSHDTTNSWIDVTLANLNLGGLINEQLKNTDLSGIVQFETNNFDFSTSEGNFEAKLDSGYINELPYDSLVVVSNWLEGLVDLNLDLLSESSLLTAEGVFDIQDSIPQLTINGSADNINLKRLTQYEYLNPVIVDLLYDIQLSAQSLDNAFGQITIEIPSAILGEDTLASHQIYADFNSQNSLEKNFRLTSSALDLSLNGEYYPTSLLELSKYWGNYLEHRVNEEILLSNELYAFSEAPDSVDQNFELVLDVKDIDLLKNYVSIIPNIETSISTTSNVNMNSERLLFNSSIFDQKYTQAEIEIDSLAVQLTGSFRIDERLKNFSNFRAIVEAEQINSTSFAGNGLMLSMSMEDDSLYVESSIDQIADDTRFELNSSIQLADTLITIGLDDFILGNDIYTWTNDGIPIFEYTNDERFIFNDFKFINENELLSFDGIFSPDLEDSVNYTIQNVDLRRISSILNGRIDFSGTVNGSFTTKALSISPSIQGNLGIDALAVSDRVVGDLDITSVFNNSLNRFDTNVLIETDSLKYPDYFSRRGRIGQNISLDGYILAPEDGNFETLDSLYYFDLDFESIDLWILPFVAPRAFTEMSGIASGSGEIWGNLKEFDYDIDYDIGVDDAVFIQPRFLDTYYYALGSIRLNRQQGLVFDDMFIIDPSGGSAILSGNYDLGDLERIHTMNLTLEMDEFQFLNNSFSPDVSFFGDAYGSATIGITGTNLNPVISTLTPVQISDFSNIGIPLLEETKLDEDNSFIQFVNDFEEEGNSNLVESNNSTTGTEGINDDPFQRSFIERFTLDLQFVTEVPMTVQLIFDPITGDIIETQGTGRLGIRLEDQQLSMFGQFDINGGQYQFVSGEIFSRRFELEPGGSIVWAGSPADAQVNLSAYYQARPDIFNLTRVQSTADSEESQRIPVQLVLDIGGALTAIQNEFYFRLPNTFELQQNSTLLAQINNLNRNEDEKLIQATSFLLMGDFIPSSTNSTEAATSLTDNFSGSAAVLNPLLSSQVISPLLSNQVNSLLRSDIGTLDIDFNLNTYNDVDLAVALRLYNDRIILSREGLITGSQSSIGDLGATYRINQTLSVTAFHRQGSTIGTGVNVEEAQQSQDVNGLGVEAQVSFDSWNEFFRRLTNPFRRIFGKKEADESVASTN